MRTWHIHIEGQVQGVGFRPFTFSLAQKLGLKGWVNNALDGVHVVFNADESESVEFYNSLIAEAPRLSKITGSEIRQVPDDIFDDFRIVESQLGGVHKLHLTPDLAICQECRQELLDPTYRRYNYPFITCIHCGPRYSIIKELPYDRDNTSMDAFDMCAQCKSEYDDPFDRRFAAQTNSCQDCRIELALYNGQQVLESKDSTYIVHKINELWEEGKIIAIKGLTGYILTCDATNGDAIKELRKRKNRLDKPLAIMLEDKAAVESLVSMNSIEWDTLVSPVAPIVIAAYKDDDEPLKTKHLIARNLSQLGVMLPNTPLFELLLNTFNQPIIATSCNAGSAPIAYEDQDALAMLSTIADYVLSNNREIAMPQDDSVVRVSPFKNQKIILRRSRGLAPSYISNTLADSTYSILALGAMLKSTFSILHRTNIYISQYLGNTDDFDCYERYHKTLRKFLELIDARPDQILVDLHKGYPSYSLAKVLADELDIPVTTIQHHKAHFGAILGEHGLIESQEPVLGVIWDGTGLGEDQQIWGGEFFNYHNYEFERSAYLDSFDFILGDKMPKEPRISAFAICWDIEGAGTLLQKKFTEIEWDTYTKVMQGKNHLQTSSMGRVFDAVASLLGIIDVQSYEGQAAMRLEQLATRYCKKEGLSFQEHYPMGGSKEGIAIKSLMTQIIEDIRGPHTNEYIAAKFHYSLTRLIKVVADELSINKLAFSGGVFQNALLVDLIQHYLSPDFELFFHEELSPNDENISFGQMVCHHINSKGVEPLPQQVVMINESEVKE